MISDVPAVCSYIHCVKCFVLIVASLFKILRHRDFDSNSGHIVVSILIDLQEFWTYENREVLLPDATAAAAAAVIGSEASTKI